MARTEVAVVVNRMVEGIALDVKRCYEQVYGDNIVEIYLYGSYARGDYNAESDIDFAAVVKGERLDLQRKLKAMWDIAADLGMERDAVISPMVIPYSEFIKYKDELPYYRNIIREGLKIE